MNPIINHLIQLQELTLIRAEQKAQRHDDRLEQLDTSIQSFTAQLPEDTRQLVARLQKRDAIVIVPVSNSVCAGCGMKLSTSLVQSVRSGSAIQSCPTCTRMLYFPESPLRRLGEPPRRTGPRKVGISRFSSQSLMIPSMKAVERDEAIAELVSKMQQEGFVDNAGRLVEEALRREAIVSTAVEHGLAFPHVRGVEGGGLTLAMGTSRKGVKFGGAGRKLTRILFFIVIPTAASAFYLKLLSGLTEAFRTDEARDALAAEDSPEKLWKTLVRLTRSTIP